MSQDVGRDFPGTVRYERYLPKRGPSGAFVFGASFAIVAYGAVLLKEQKEEQR